MQSVMLILKRILFFHTPRYAGTRCWPVLSCDISDQDSQDISRECYLRENYPEH